MQCSGHSPHLQSLELLNPLTAIIGQNRPDWIEGGGPSDISPWGANGDIAFLPQSVISLPAIVLLT